MEYQGTISYWLKKGDQETLLVSTPINKVPTVGDIFPIDTTMDKDWFDANFPQKEYQKLYQPGVNGYFRVTRVQRYIGSYPHVSKIPVDEKKGSFIKTPSLIISENFEVFVEQVKGPIKKKYDLPPEKEEK